MTNRRMATPDVVRFPVGTQVEPRSAARQPMARPQEPPGYDLYSIAGCAFYLIAAVVLLGSAVAFLVLVE